VRPTAVQPGRKSGRRANPIASCPMRTCWGMHTFRLCMQLSDLGHTRCSFKILCCAQASHLRYRQPHHARIARGSAQLPVCTAVQHEVWCSVLRGATAVTSWLLAAGHMNSTPDALAHAPNNSSARHVHTGRHVSPTYSWCTARRLQHLVAARSVESPSQYCAAQARA
jgi:hypothetical protein